MKNYICLAVVLAVCSACSMKKTSEDIRDTSKRLETKSSQLLGATCKVVNLGTKATSLEVIKKASDLENLFNPNVRGAEKLANAATVFEGMWFQSWDGNCGNDPKILDRAYAKSVHFLFSQIHDHISDEYSVDASTLNPLDDNEYNGLASLGAMMGVVGDEYVAAMKAANLPAMSFYDLVISALKLEDAYNRGEEVPDYVVEVLKWKPEMVYLLQLRHNYLAGIILVLATDIEDSLVSAAKLKYFYRDVSLVGSSARTQQYLDWLNNILQTRADLKSFGIKIKVNSDFATGMSSVRWVPSSSKNTGKNLSQKESDLESTFIKTYSEIVTENAHLLKAEEFSLLPRRFQRQP